MITITDRIQFYKLLGFNDKNKNGLVEPVEGGYKKGADKIRKDGKIDPQEAVLAVWENDRGQLKKVLNDTNTKAQLKIEIIDILFKVEKYSESEIGPKIKKGLNTIRSQAEKQIAAKKAEEEKEKKEAEKKKTPAQVEIKPVKTQSLW